VRRLSGSPKALPFPPPSAIWSNFANPLTRLTSVSTCQTLATCAGTANGITVTVY